MELISIIVPVYKVENYLDRCVESLVNQTYKNLEIILVDDGSPDSCGKRCDLWAEQDKRIKVIHKKNGGLSDARNYGINNASGEFVAFVDSDDWIEPQMYETLYNAIIENDCDIASCGVRRVWENKKECMLTKLNGDHILNRIEAMEALMDSSYLIMTVWNKLYKRQIVKDELFPVGKINEDEFWSWKIICKANRVISIEHPFYNYFQRNDGIMAQEACKYPMLVVDAKCQRHKYIQENMPSLKNKSCMDLIYTCLFQAQLAQKSLSREQRKVCLNDMKEIVKQHRPEKVYISSMPLKQRLRFEQIYHLFKITCYIQNFFHVGV